jgi:uncharacterized protein (TIGR02246 family)
MNVRARTFAAVAAIALLTLLSAPAAEADARRADAAADAALARTLQARLDEAYGPVWATGDPKRFVDAILTDDVVLTGSDTTHAWRGREQAVALITELMKVAPTVKARALHTRRLGPDVAYQFVVFDLQGKDPAGKDTTLTAKSLYVWTRGRDGWRIAADHYSLVGMDALQ